MIKIKEAVIVEGKYDKIALTNVIDALIIPCNGFSLYKDKALLNMIRQLADAIGLIILTDSDAAGFQIRAKICSCVPSEKVKHAYIPDVLGRERRKRTASKAGTLGVEGMSPEILSDAILQAATVIERKKDAEKITKADFFHLGLTGGERSRQLRKQLLSHLSLPAQMQTNALLTFVNRFYSKHTFYDLMHSINNH